MVASSLVGAQRTSRRTSSARKPRIMFGGIPSTRRRGSTSSLPRRSGTELHLLSGRTTFRTCSSARRSSGLLSWSMTQMVDCPHNSNKVSPLRRVEKGQQHKPVNNPCLICSSYLLYKKITIISFTYIHICVRFNFLLDGFDCLIYLFIFLVRVRGDRQSDEAGNPPSQATLDPKAHDGLPRPRSTPSRRLPLRLCHRDRRREWLRQDPALPPDRPPYPAPALPRRPLRLLPLPLLRVSLPISPAQPARSVPPLNPTQSIRSSVQPTGSRIRPPSSNRRPPARRIAQNRVLH